MKQMLLRLTIQVKQNLMINNQTLIIKGIQTVKITMSLTVKAKKKISLKKLECQSSNQPKFLTKPQFCLHDHMMTNLKRGNVVIAMVKDWLTTQSLERKAWKKPM
jgi:hypothetical protein